MLDIEKVKEEFGYDGKPAQWQVGFDSLLRHLSDYVPSPANIGEEETRKCPNGDIIKFVPKTITIYNFDQLTKVGWDYGFPLDITVVEIK